MSDELWLPEGARTTNYGRPRTGVPSEAEDALRRGLKLGMAEDTGDRLTMAHNRRTASAARMGGGGVSMAIGRPRDPMFYWEQNNLPYKFDTREGLAKIREYSRAVYLTHPIIGSAVDIYCNWPLQGLELRCTDNALTDFYTDLFLDEDRLDYQEHLVDIGREYWVTGECFSLGSFNDSLGVWEDDELIDPDDVEVIVSPFLKEPRFEMRLPESIRTVLEKRNPVWEYEALLRSYPELRFFMSDDKARMPVSSILLRRLKFKAHNFSVRGLPILMRAFRTLMQEEMLNAAFDSVASRLYTPLILANIGASAQELGTSQPWIPSDGDIMDFQDRLDSALAADFRVLVSHFAVKMQNVFGREMLPRAGEDFDRIDGRLLQVFGISQSMLSGACLTGDTIIRVSRAGKSFTMPLVDLVARFNGNDRHMAGRKWSARPEIDTYVARADGDRVRLGLLAAAYPSGVKPVFLLQTEGGRSIKASADHPFLRDDGAWVRLEDLFVGDCVRINTGKPATLGISKGLAYKTAWCKYHPYQNRRGYRDGSPRYSVAVHRAVMEAHLNNLSYDEFIDVIKYDEARAKELFYLDPSLCVVHHIDEDRHNNDLANLSVMSTSDHHSHHSDPEFVWWLVGSDRITSIEYVGEEMTYDLTMADDPHNFIANDFVVHNSKGQTYAADALNFELVSQLLSRFQRLIKGFYRQRALVVAEAQGHYAYEVRGGRRYPVMEEILEVDEKGEQRIVERPKLLVPDISFRTMNMQSEQDQRQFVEALRAGGVPISMRTRLTNVPIDLDEERDLVQDEQVANAVAAQEVRRRTYEQLIAQRLPVPEDLQADFGPTALQGDQPTVDQIATPEEQVAPPALGTDEPADTEALVPVDDLLSDPEGEPSVDRLPRSKWLEDGGQSSRPAQSDERRDGMPRAASLTTAGQVLVPMERVLIDPAAQDDNGNLLTGAGSLQLGPAHIGRRAILDPDIPLDDQLASMGWQ